MKDNILRKTPYYIFALLVYILLLTGLFVRPFSIVTIVIALVLILFSLSYPIYIILKSREERLRLYISVILTEFIILAIQLTGNFKSPFFGIFYLLAFLLGSLTEFYVFIIIYIAITVSFITTGNHQFGDQLIFLLISLILGYISSKKEFFITTMKTQLNSIETHKFISPESADIEEKMSMIFSGGDDQYTYYKEKTLYSITDLIFKVFTPHTAAVFLVDKTGEYLVLGACRSKSKNINENVVIKEEKNLLYWVVKYRRDMMNNEFTLPVTSLDFYTKDEPVRSFMAIQVTFENRVLGVIVLDSLEENAFTWEDKEKLKHFATIVAISIILINDIQLKNRDSVKFSILKDISTTLLRHLEINEIYNHLHDTLKKMMPFDSLFLIRIEGEKGRFIKIFGNEYFKEGEGFSFSNSLISVTVKNNIPILRNMKETEFKRIPILYPGEHIKKGYQSFILFPIIDPHGESADNRLVLLFVNKSQKIRYDEKMVRDIITPTANIFATAIERSLLYEKVKDLAIKDGLTGLYNHRYFQTTLKEMLREAQVNRYPIALIMIDIDFFKSFNDKYGHQTGDRVLKHLAEIIKRIIPSNALPARYGGEEFVVVLPNKNENQAVEFAEQLRSAVENTSIKYNDTLLKITISLGVAVFDGKYLSSDILIKHADLALYDSKKNGRNKTTIH